MRVRLKSHRHIIVEICLAARRAGTHTIASNITLNSCHADDTQHTAACKPTFVISRGTPHTPTMKHYAAAVTSKRYVQYYLFDELHARYKASEADIAATSGNTTNHCAD